MIRLALLAAVACVGPAERSDDAWSTATAPTDLEPPPWTGACAPDPDLEVLSFTATSGPTTTLLELSVTLSAPAPVAVACVSDEDPAEVFLAESADAADAHTLRLSGLLARTAYTCAAAPTCPTLAGGPATLAHETGAPPSDLRQLDVTVDPELGMQGAWTLAPYALNLFGLRSWLVIWGPDGRPRWWHELPGGVGLWVEALYHPDRGDIVWGGGFSAEGRVRAVDLWDGETYAWAPPGWEDDAFHHDAKRLADGRMLTLEERPNALGDEDWVGFGIRLHDPATGDLHFDFDSQTLVDQGLLAPGIGFDADPYHANWVDWVEQPTGPEVYVSLCHSWQILALDGDDGSLRWQLGRGLGWTVLDADGAPLPEDALPQCQHGLEVEGDTFLVYDNAQARSESSAAAWRIDGATRTATRLWTWSEPGWQEDWLGDIDRLPNDRIFLTQATSFGVSELVEVDLATGSVASRATYGTGGLAYRAQRYEGCDLFTSARWCPALAARYDLLAPLLTP